MAISGFVWRKSGATNGDGYELHEGISAIWSWRIVITFRRCRIAAQPERRLRYHGEAARVEQAQALPSRSRPS